jgi:hypothetical protein
MTANRQDRWSDLMTALENHMNVREDGSLKHQEIVRALAEAINASR